MEEPISRTSIGRKYKDTHLPEASDVFGLYEIPRCIVLLTSLFGVRSCRVTLSAAWADKIEKE